MIQNSSDLPVFLQLLDTKSTDRKLTLLHYIANVVKEKYAQVCLFYNELHYVEKAAAGESHGPGGWRGEEEAGCLTAVLGSVPGERPAGREGAEQGLGADQA